jgi:hypothetical protein
MVARHIFIWTGGEPPPPGDETGRLADALPTLPRQAPLRRAAHIRFQWGEAIFDILATGCSVRTTAWGSAQVTWLHCKGMHVGEIKPDEPTNLVTVWIPAHYVIGLQPGPTFRLGRTQPLEDWAIFPPSRPTPADRLPLADIESELAKLLAPERN